MRIKKYHAGVSINGNGFILIDVDADELKKEIGPVEGIPAEKLDIKITRHRERRSLDANAYLWQLCDKIAAALNTTKTDIYRQAVNAVGRFEDVAVAEDAADRFAEIWQSRGIGWITEIYPCNVPGCKDVRVYYGSSCYNTAEMSRLIDYVVQDANEIGVETMTPADLERLKNAWGDGNV